MRPHDPGRGGRGKERGARGKPPRSEEPEGLGTVLDALLEERPWRAGHALGGLGRRWPQIVGARLAQECSPVALDGGTLLIRASSAAWGAQLTFLADEVRRRANETMRSDVVRAVRVVLDRTTR